MRDILIFILQKINKITYKKLEFIIYLLDRKYTLKKEKQFTNIQWIFDIYWPDSMKEILKILEINNDIFYIKNKIVFLNEKYKKTEIKIDWNIEIYNILEDIVNMVNEMSDNDFTKYIYSTYPIYKSRIWDFLNLEKISIEFNKIINKI